MEKQMTQKITTEEKIRHRAYEIWLSQGCPHGRDREHWLAAEREMLSTNPARFTDTSKAMPAEPTVQSRDSQTTPVRREVPAAAKTSASRGRTSKSTLANLGTKGSPASQGKKSPPP
jgi:hypothetical protein